MTQGEDQRSYLKFRAFIDCKGREATHRVGTNQSAAKVTPGKPCYTHEGSDLLLCDSCLAFWRECKDNANQATWQMALYFRDLHDPAS